MTVISKRFINTDGDNLEDGLTGDDIAVSHGSTLTIAQALYAGNSVGGGMADVLSIVDSRVSGAFGGTSISGENKRGVWEVTRNSITGATLDEHGVYLPQGTYWVSAEASVVRSGLSRAVVRAYGVPLLVGGAVFVDANFGQANVSCAGTVTLDEGAHIELFSHNELGCADIGLGAPVSVLPLMGADRRRHGLQLAAHIPPARQGPEYGQGSRT